MDEKRDDHDQAKGPLEKELDDLERAMNLKFTDLERFLLLEQASARVRALAQAPAAGADGPVTAFAAAAASDDFAARCREALDEELEAAAREDENIPYRIWLEWKARVNYSHCVENCQALAGGTA